MNKQGIIKAAKKNGKKAWNFFWEEDSMWSWLANIIVAFLIIRFLVYPLLGLILGTNYPIVAVISESMQHNTDQDLLCGQRFADWQDSFDNYWQVCGSWYQKIGISKEQFHSFPFRNGFDKGDVIFLWRANPDNIKVGDILVFQGPKVQPIIHRVVKIKQEGDQKIYQTKGDHNSESISGSDGETDISQKRIYGQGLLRIPYLGWVKILFVDAVRPLGWNIQR